MRHKYNILARNADSRDPHFSKKTDVKLKKISVEEEKPKKTLDFSYGLY